MRLLLARLAAGAALLAALCGPAQAAGPRAIDWSDLAPLAAPVADPFAALGDEQLDALRGIVKSRMLEARGLPVSEAGRAQRAAWQAQLEAQGLDVERLLAEREQVMARRRAAAEAAVPALDGTEVALAGYLMPVAGGDRKGHDFLLVAFPGACSHAAPPPPNQVLRVRSAQPARLTADYTPVLVHGRLRLRAERATVYAIDGELAVGSSYAIDDAQLTVPR